MTKTQAGKSEVQRGATSRAMRLSPEERLGHLLACAIKVFAEHGLVASNHNKVAAEAQVSVPAVFFYFKTREALVDAVLSEVERFFISRFVRAGNVKGPADQTLMQLSQAMTHTLMEYPDYARIMMEWSVAVRSDLWPRYLRTYRRINRVLVKVIERGQKEGCFRPDLNPEDEAAILHAASTALIQMMETGVDAERIDRFQRAMVQTVMILPAAPAAAARPATQRRAVSSAGAPR
ncbi:MAG: TetR/AcrR family transcriptional regulator [Gallionella sp.]|nr:TetR/AcrR family transcriptional regulator [Gallionella sp.]